MKQTKAIFIILFSIVLLLNYLEVGSQSNKNDTNDVKLETDLNISIGDTIQGKIIKVFDGDTYELLIDKKHKIRIRMEGIDAPEGGMPYYRVAKDVLTTMAATKEVKTLIMDKDHYGRFVAYTYLEDGRELSREMIKAGLAWHYKQYNDDKALAQLEKVAKENRQGLWREYPYVIPPWTVRKLNRQGYKTAEIHKAQREHLKGMHKGGCPDKKLCDELSL